MSIRESSDVSCLGHRDDSDWIHSVSKQEFLVTSPKVQYVHLKQRRRKMCVAIGDTYSFSITGQCCIRQGVAKTGFVWCL